MRMGCCRPARRTTRPVWRGWWRRRCRPPVRCRSVDRCCWAARPGCLRWWCMSNPWASRQPDYGARHVAALVLLVEPGRHPRLDPDVVTRTLRLTPAESQVAVWLADGQERARHRPGHGTHGRRHLLAPEADLQANCQSHGRWTWCGWCCRSPSSGNRGAAGVIAGRAAGRPRAFSSPIPEYFLQTTNPVSDWIALQTLALGVLQRWRMVAGSLPS